MTRLVVVGCAVAAVLALCPPSTMAQVTGTAPGPRLAPVLRTYHVPGAAGGESTVTEMFAQRRARSRAPGTVLMIVGGAVAVAGILAEESLLVIGGVGVAGYGLYLYLRSGGTL